MKATIRVGVGCVLFACAMAVSAEDIDLTADGWRPLAKAISQLSVRLGRIITYEDPRYAYSGDLRDAGAEIRNGERAGPRIQVPAGGMLELRGLALPSSKDMDATSSMIREVLAAQDRSETGGKFRLLRTGDVLHVIPASVRDPSGAWIDQSSVLDVRISIPNERRTTYAMVEAVASAVGEANDLRVVFVTLPISMSASDAALQGADNEIARDVLMRALARTGNKYAWTLFYTPISNGNTYLLDVTQLPNDESSPTGNGADGQREASPGALPGVSSPPEAVPRQRNL